MPYYEQPGRVTSTDKDGKRTLTVTFVGDAEAPVPSGVSGTLRSKTVTTDVAGQIRTQYIYELDVSSGSASGLGVAQVQVEIVSATRTVPIEAHPNFGGSQISSGGFIKPQGLKIIKDAVQTPGKSYSDIEDAVRDSGSDATKGRSLFGYLAAGITSYYEPSLIIRKTYQASGPPAAGRIGKISSPNVFISGLPKGANFLLINVSSRGENGSFTVTEEYEMSGEGGWDTFLYT